MKQLSFLAPSGQSGSSSLPIKKTTWSIFIDGASRNNPGLSGAGIIVRKDGSIFDQQGFFLGTKTNNQAEYLALLLGLLLVKQVMKPGDVIEITSDSLLLVKQMSGEYKVRNPNITQLHSVGCEFLYGLEWRICHVLRADNVEADEYANIGIDRRNKVPPEFAKILNEHSVYL